MKKILFSLIILFYQVNFCAEIKEQLETNLINEFYAIIKVFKIIRQVNDDRVIKYLGNPVPFYYRTIRGLFVSVSASGMSLYTPWGQIKIYHDITFLNSIQNYMVLSIKGVMYSSVANRYELKDYKE